MCSPLKSIGIYYLCVHIKFSCFSDSFTGHYEASPLIFNLIFFFKVFVQYSYGHRRILVVSICIERIFFKSFYFHPVCVFEIEQSFVCGTSFYVQSSNFSLLIRISSLFIFNVILENKVYVTCGFINEIRMWKSVDLLEFMLVDVFELMALFLSVIY